PNRRGEPFVGTGPTGMVESWSGGTMALTATEVESGVDAGLLRTGTVADAGLADGDMESPREGTRPTVAQEAARSRAASGVKNQSSSARSSGAASTGKLMQGM